MRWITICPCNSRSKRTSGCYQRNAFRGCSYQTWLCDRCEHCGVNGGMLLGSNILCNKYIKTLRIHVEVYHRGKYVDYNSLIPAFTSHLGIPVPLLSSSIFKIFGTFCNPCNIFLKGTPTKYRVQNE